METVPSLRDALEGWSGVLIHKGHSLAFPLLVSAWHSLCRRWSKENKMNWYVNLALYIIPWKRMRHKYPNRQGKIVFYPKVFWIRAPLKRWFSVEVKGPFHSVDRVGRAPWWRSQNGKSRTAEPWFCWVSTYMSVVFSSYLLMISW